MVGGFDPQDHGYAANSGYRTVRIVPFGLLRLRRCRSISVAAVWPVSFPNRGTRHGEGQQLTRQGKEETQKGRQGAPRQGGTSTQKEVMPTAGVE